MSIDGSPILLSTAYFPPIQYFTLFMEGSDIIIEGHENYTKQTYRNRCKIYSPNGVQVLSVPVERGSFHKVNITDLRIDYSRPWQNNHLRALKTAYSSSAFYEFYIDELAEIISQKYDYLIDMNMDMLGNLLALLELDNKLDISLSYKDKGTVDNDYRDSFHPKKEDQEFIYDIPEYFQVFSIEKGFVPNLSILDLIFNMGPEAYSYLLSCRK